MGAASSLQFAAARRYVCLAAALLVLLIILTGCNQAPSNTSLSFKSPRAKQNIVWIVLDACRADHMSCYGYARPTTPNIDALAARGTIFREHFAQGFGTVVSVPSYLTGRYYPTASLGLGGWQEACRVPPPDEILAPAIFSANGYATTLVSAHVWITPESRLWQNFETQYFIKPDNPQDGYADCDSLLPPIRETLAAAQDGPFFLYVHVMDTHFPHRLSAPYDKWVNKSYTSSSIVNGYHLKATGNTFSEDDQALLNALHDGSLLKADNFVGQIVALLQEFHHDEDTLIVISADHGDALGEDSATAGHPRIITDEIMQVPLIIAGPGIPSSKRIDAITQNVDILPTLVELSSLDTSARFDGKSVVPLLRGEVDAVHGWATARLDTKGYEGPPVVVVRNATAKLAFSTATGEAQLWQLPHRLGKEAETGAAKPGDVRALREIWERELRPEWEAYLALPRTQPTVPVVVSITEAAFIPESAVFRSTGKELSASADTDGKWVLHDGKLWSDSFQDNAPPVTAVFNLPDGKYQLAAELYSNLDYFGHPASALNISVDSGPARTLVTNTPTAAYIYLDVGEVTTSGGQVQIHLDEANTSHWAYLRSFRFTPAGFISESTPSEETNERLRALGYL